MYACMYVIVESRMLHIFLNDFGEYGVSTLFTYWRTTNRTRYWSVR